MNNGVYEKVLNFKRKYPSTIAWRLKAHSKVVEKHLNQGEKVLYAFAGQKNNHFYDIISTHVFVITNKRLIIATKRVLFGYFLYSITPDMFNDLTEDSEKTQLIKPTDLADKVDVRKVPDENTEEYSTDTFMFSSKDFDDISDLRESVRKSSTFIKILIVLVVLIVLAGAGFIVYNFFIK